MDFSPANLLASMVIGTVGFGFFMYGRKQQRLPQLVAGIALVVYPYFIASIGWMIGVAVVIVAALWLALRAGL